MANFEGEKRLNRETSELEVNGKFELSNDDLEKVSGGQVDYEASAGYKVNVNGHLFNVVDGEWGCPCRAFGHEPNFQINPYGGCYGGKYCEYCLEFRRLDTPINGWHGYCIWEG